MTKLWEDDPGLLVETRFKGITTPINELYEEIHKRGWEPKVDFKDDQYRAEGKNPHGESVEASGPTDATAVGNLLLLIMRRETIRQSAFHIAQWDQSFANKMEEIAKAYAKAPIYDPKAAPAWKELADDSTRRAEVLRQQLKIEEVNEPEPYQSSQEMCEDIHKNKHFLVSRANTTHPMWSMEQNIAFRIVHDVLGHCVSGGDFGWQGENLACSAHFPLLTPLAQKALFTECIAQTAAGAYFRSFMPQKVAFVDDFIEPAQEQENAPNHQGLHPSQTLAPGQMPEVPQSPPPEETGGLSWATQIPNPDFSGAMPVYGSEIAPTDPNANWSSGLDPLPNNAYLWHGDPLGASDTRDNARRVDTGWAGLSQPNGKPDMDSMRQAIVNAFRAVLLSPRKDLRSNAIHYQDLMGVPATVADPKRYWDALEGRREAWNQARQYPPQSHKPYWKEQMDFQSYIRALNPNMEPEDAYKLADDEFRHMWNEEEDKLTADPKNEKLSADEIERKIAKSITKRLKMITKPGDEKTDYGHEQLLLSSTHDQDHNGYGLRTDQEMLSMQDDQATFSVGAEQGSSGWSPNILSKLHEGKTTRVQSEIQQTEQRTTQEEIPYRHRGTDSPASDKRKIQTAAPGSGERQTSRALSAEQGERSESQISHSNEIRSLRGLSSDIPMADNGSRSHQREEGISSEPRSNFQQEPRGGTKRDSEVRSTMRELSSNAALSSEQRFGETQMDLEGQEAGKYPAFMGSHLNAISQISENSDKILKAALEDVQEHNGTGHHFRSEVLNLGVPGVGPKVASLAWLFLQPMTSQLATIDTHMMDVLGHDYGKEMNDRDYFKFERELEAGRDAAGYGHVPLGQFQWSMWDNKRTGPGTHQDHSALKVLNPTPHNQINWGAKTPVQQDWQEPEWWSDTQPMRDQVSSQWDNDIATQFPKNKIPITAKKTAARSQIPWIFQQGQVVVGDPGETGMILARRILGLSTEEVWKLEPQPGFEVGSYDPITGQIYPMDHLGVDEQQVVEDALRQRGTAI